MDLINEELVSLKTARKELIPRRNGKPIAPSTVWRWVNRGLRLRDGSRAQLEVVRIGGTPMTSKEALVRFFSRLTEARAPKDAAVDEPAERPEATQRRLQDAGLV